LSGGFTGKIFNTDKTLPEKFLQNQPEITYIETLFLGWEYYTFTSSVPLTGYDENLYYSNYQGRPFQFQNDLICCRAKGHLMIFTRGKKAYLYFIEHFIELFHNSKNLNSKF